MIVTKSYGGAGPYQWNVSHDMDGNIKSAVCYSSSASSYYEVKSAANVDTGSWFHFTLTFDGSLADSLRVQLFTNGVKGRFSRKQGTQGTTTVNTNQEISIGGSYSLSAIGNSYTGLIDDVRIYNRVINQSEIDTLAGLITTGIKQTEIPEQIGYSIFPNPSTGVFNIQIENTDRAVAIEVYNTVGKLVTTARTSNKQAIVDLSEQPVGVYFVRIGNQAASRVIVK